MDLCDRQEGLKMDAFTSPENSQFFSIRIAPIYTNFGKKIDRQG